METGKSPNTPKSTAAAKSRTESPKSSEVRFRFPSLTFICPLNCLTRNCLSGFVIRFYESEARRILFRFELLGFSGGDGRDLIGVCVSSRFLNAWLGLVRMELSFQRIESCLCLHDVMNLRKCLKWVLRRDKSKPRGSVDVFAAQCAKCHKWRTLDSLEEYEELRSRFIEDPFHCDKKPNVSCDDPADIEYDNTKTWVIDKPNIPKTPPGFKRELILRRDFSKMDAHYITPTGKKVRSRSEVAAFVKENPQYKDVNIDDFNFTVPKVMEDTIPGTGNVKKKIKKPDNLAENVD
ncbi:Methyl-CpG-binding domain-containing protein [Drosera capensis]